MPKFLTDITGELTESYNCEVTNGDLLGGKSLESDYTRLYKSTVFLSYIPDAAELTSYTKPGKVGVFIGFTPQLMGLSSL